MHLEILFIGSYLKTIFLKDNVTVFTYKSAIIPDYSEKLLFIIADDLGPHDVCDYN